MFRVFYRLIAMIARLAVRSGRSKDLEIIVLRHQLTVLRRQINRPVLDDADRTLLEVARDELVDDIDVDHLWNPALDGIENDHELQHHWRMINLHPTTWFDRFRPTR